MSKTNANEIIGIIADSINRNDFDGALDALDRLESVLTGLAIRKAINI